MTKLEKLLSQYAAYHLDRKNVYTHFLGIPLIIFSVMCVLSRWGVYIYELDVTLALLVLLVITAFYISLDKGLGIVIGVLFAIAYPFAAFIGQLSFTTWSMWSISLFFIGWVFQFIGHMYEKKKPAFVDDLTGLAIGPLFVVAELVFLLGYRKNLERTVMQEGQRQRSLMDQASKTMHSSY